MVIIDPIVKFIDLLDFNDYGSAYGAIDPIKKALDARKVAGIFAHHCKKSVAELDAFDGLLGSTGWGASCDTRLILRRQRGSDEATLIAGGRDVLHSESALLFDGAKGWIYQGAAKDVRISDERKEIIDLLGREGPLASKEIADILEKNGSTTRNLLRKMLDQGELLKEIDGRWNSRRRVDSVDSQATGAVSPKPLSTASTPSIAPTTTTLPTAKREEEEAANA